MKALGWILASLIQTLLFKFDLLKPLVGLANQLHAFCLAHMGNSDLNWFYAAILFGDDTGLRQKSEIQSFMVLGLYHLIVVSGSHLTILDKIVIKPLFFFSPRVKIWLATVFLGVFTFANQLQAACLRAFVNWVLRKFCGRRISDEADLQVITTCFCLLLQPALCKSLSFQLSCAASMALSVVGSFQLTSTKWNKVLTPLCCILFTAPLIFNIQPCISWIVIPVNVLALPIVEFSLIPLSLVGYALPFLKFITEYCLHLMFHLLDFLAKFTEPLLCLSQEGSKNWGIVYIFSLLFVWRLLLPFFRRREFVKDQNQRVQGM